MYVFIHLDLCTLCVYIYICINTQVGVFLQLWEESIGAQVLLPHDLPHAGLEAGSPQAWKVTYNVVDSSSIL